MMIAHLHSLTAVRCLVLLCGLAVPLAAAAAGGNESATAPPAASTRCGWFDNPSPGNADLLDAGGSWSVAQQGGHQAQGDWPTFAGKHWVRTGVGSYGYGCACLTGRFDADSQAVLTIARSRSRPLSACRADKALQGLEPVNPLK
ncbi:DUF4087 domain-containing protein [Acidovorax sp. NPDC077693]|uniref:DUF4087 domain-containing protein n=1 Tax=Acidovorax sp. NPDC077693 TaxID=3363889 RepID=UPI0037C52A6E